MAPLEVDIKEGGQHQRWWSINSTGKFASLGRREERKVATHKKAEGRENDGRKVRLDIQITIIIFALFLFSHVQLTSLTCH
jgi:hypothetical protein